MTSLGLAGFGSLVVNGHGGRAEDDEFERLAGMGFQFVRDSGWENNGGSGANGVSDSSDGDCAVAAEVVVDFVVAGMVMERAFGDGNDVDVRDTSGPACDDAADVSIGAFDER